MFPPSGECSRRVPQPLLHWRIAFPTRDRIQEFDGIGQESAQAADDKGFEIGRRDPLTSGTVRLGASDEAAGDVVAIPRSLLDRVGVMGSEPASKTMPVSRLGSRALSPSRRSIR